MVSSHICRSPMPWALMHPHPITEAGFCSFRWYSLHNTISSCISWCSGRLCWVTMIFQSTPEPMWLCPSWWHDGFSNNAIKNRNRWSCAFSSGFRPWPLRTEISPDLLNLFMIIWTVDGERPILFAILSWETLSLNWLTILSQSLAQCGEPWPFLACKD